MRYIRDLINHLVLLPYLKIAKLNPQILQFILGMLSANFLLGLLKCVGVFYVCSGWSTVLKWIAKPWQYTAIYQHVLPPTGSQTFKSMTISVEFYNLHSKLKLKKKLQTFKDRLIGNTWNTTASYVSKHLYRIVLFVLYIALSRSIF